MKNLFFEHHKYSEETFNELMNNAIFVLDTNVLLHIYRYNEENVDKLFEVIDKIKERLWCPNQIANEFYKNRTKLIINKATFLNDLKDQLTKDLIKIEGQMNNPSGSNNAYAFLRFEDDLKKFVIDKLNALASEVSTHIDTLTNGVSLDYLINEDPILEKIVTYFEGKVGLGFDKNKLGEIYKDGKNRYDNGIPPGYEDKDKPEPGRYGDLVIWEEIIEYASTSKKDVVYITDDVKEDWWFILRGKKAGPRHELIKEFKERTDHLFYAYTSEKFVDLISSKYNIKDTESLREESKEVVNSISFESYTDLSQKISDDVIKGLILRRARGKCECCGATLIDENGEFKVKSVVQKKDIHEKFSAINGMLLCQICSEEIIFTGIICTRCKHPTMGSGGAENVCGNCGLVTDEY